MNTNMLFGELTKYSFQYNQTFTPPESECRNIPVEDMKTASQLPLLRSTTMKTIADNKAAPSTAPINVTGV